MAAAPTLVERILARDVRAIARAISLIENDGSQAAEILQAVFAHTGRGAAIGITGAPGAGKSTLVDKLALNYRRRGRTVGIIAVDPSSPYSGGALLGDRIRMQTLAGDPGVFIRSMATRGNLGGLARATVDAVAVLEAAGYDRVLVETVGVGQDEVEVVKAADISVVVLVPGMGDDIQAIKAGIMEIADIFVINKAEREGVERTERELLALLEMSDRPDGWKPPIIRTVATQNRGIDEFTEALENYRNFRGTASPSRLVSVAENRLLDLLRDKLLRRALAEALAPGELREFAAAVAAKERDPYSIVAEISRRIQMGASQLEKLQHLGIAVKSIDEALEFWRDGLGLELQGIEIVEDQGVRVAMLPLGESRIELLEATGSETTVGRFISKRGAGIHHLCVEVSDLAAKLADLKARGVRLIDEEPRIGAGGALVAFIHPVSTGGVLIELTQKTKN
ncbi:MAG: methylmalonyl Co-A mutase-associated GTPase MeaB [Blastocatellia bacterium]|nr:methylmalonyl Co-A mutase-associated GTPase MeaB [Blastocatellia bacterium]